MDKTISWLPAGTRSSRCDGCQSQMFWIDFYGKKHPFNFDGQSHVETCSALRNKRVGITTLADIDTFYRERWREMFLGDANGFRKDGFIRCEVPEKRALRLAEVLSWYGGPLRSVSYPVADIVESIHWGGQNDAGELIAVSVDEWIWYGLRRCLPPDVTQTPIHYKIDDLYITKADGE